MRFSLVWFLVMCLLVAGCSDGHGGKRQYNFTSNTADNGGGSAGGGGVGGSSGGGSGGEGEGNEGGSEPPAARTCDYSTIDESWRPDSDPVWYFNAKFYDNHTARWKNGSIKVKVYDSRVDLLALQSLFEELNPLIHPARLEIANGNGKVDIEIIYSPSLPMNTGQTLWNVNHKNRITYALIELADFDSDDCYFYAVLKHHLIRSLGFFDYTRDGGVMAEEIHNDYLTILVAETLTTLYDLKPGSEVGPDGFIKENKNDDDDEDDD